MEFAVAERAHGMTKGEIQIWTVCVGTTKASILIVDIWKPIAPVNIGK